MPAQPIRTRITCLVALAAAAACGESLRPPQSDEWRLPVDGSVRTIEGDAVTEPEARTPIGVSDLAAPAPSEGLTHSLLVDQAGNLYVLDYTAMAVKVFDAEGRLLRSFGERGREAGQLFGPMGLVWLAGRVGVIDNSAARLSIWSTTGEHQRDLPSATFLNVIDAHGLPGGRMIARVLLASDLQGQQTLSILTEGGEEVARIAFLPHEQAELGRIFPRPAVAVGSDRLFVTTGEAYQVHAYDFDGGSRWALRVHWPRDEVTDEVIGRSMERTRRAGRAMGENVRGVRGPEIPDYLPALASLAVDGEGRLYVFPYVEDVESTDSFPVDVYDADGNVLLHGSLPFQGWSASQGSEIYRTESDVLTGTTRVRRYRLDLPDE